jgi:hypothetical protein
MKKKVGAPLYYVSRSRVYSVKVRPADGNRDHDGELESYTPHNLHLLRSAVSRLHFR